VCGAEKCVLGVPHKPGVGRLCAAVLPWTVTVVLIGILLLRALVKVQFFSQTGCLTASPNSIIGSSLARSITQTRSISTCYEMPFLATVLASALFSTITAIVATVAAIATLSFQQSQLWNYEDTIFVYMYTCIMKVRLVQIRSFVLLLCVF